MEGLVEFLKQVGRPSSVAFLVTALGVGVALAFSSRALRAARWYFTAMFVGYWIFTTPACSEWLTRQASGDYHAIAAASEARGARVVVVLGAGNNAIRASGGMLQQISPTAALRVLEAVRLYRLLGEPTLIVSGGTTDRDPGAVPEAESLREAALRLGVPADRIVLETESKNTREEAQVIRRMLDARASEPIVLVTSGTHMPRSMAVFRAAGLNPIPSVAAYKSEGSLGRYRWLPSDAGLWLVTAVVYDTAATCYYWSRGWLRS